LLLKFPLIFINFYYELLYIEELRQRSLWNNYLYLGDRYNSFISFEPSSSNSAGVSSTSAISAEELVASLGLSTSVIASEELFVSFELSTGVIVPEESFVFFELSIVAIVTKESFAFFESSIVAIATSSVDDTLTCLKLTN
jgi:hypothetical protein